MYSYLLGVFYVKKSKIKIKDSLFPEMTLRIETLAAIQLLDLLKLLNPSNQRIGKGQ